jgi:hypothetical protein
MKYVVWDHKTVNGQEISQFELSFTGRRCGVASWLAAPGPMGSLDFVSPKAAITASILLKDPQKIYDEAADLVTASNPNALASLAQMEQGLKLSLREDLFARLGGEITLELDALPPQEPLGKVLLRAKDPRGLLATLKTFFVASRVTPTELDEDGITYYTLPISGQKPLAFYYAMVDEYLIFASSHAALAEAIRLHRSGESLAKSGMLAASMPPGNSGDVSALLYEDPRAMAALGLMNVSPELADSLLKSTAENQPAVVAVYGEETALREASHSSGVDFGGAMVVAAIAIPNLMRARMAAHEGSAAGKRSDAEHGANYLFKRVSAEGLCPRPSNSRSGSQRIQRHLCATCQPDRLQFGRSELYRRRMVHQVWISLHHYDRVQAAAVPRICRYCHTCQHEHRDAQLVFYLRRSSSLSARAAVNFTNQGRRVQKLGTSAIAEWICSAHAVFERARLSSRAVHAPTTPAPLGAEGGYTGSESGPRWRELFGPTSSRPAACVCCDLLRPAQDVADVVRSRSWVHHHNPQHSAAVEYGGTDVAKSALIELFLDCPTMPIRITIVWAPQPEAENVRVRLMHRLKNLRFRTVPKRRLGNVADMCRQVIPKLSAVHAPHQPGFERIESLRARNGKLAQVGPAPLGAEQVRRLFLQGTEQARPVAHQDSAGGQRHEHHFVRIKDHRVSLVETLQSPTEAAAEGETGPMRRIDVEPRAVLSRNLRQGR